jgi:hypothetical protein
MNYDAGSFGDVARSEMGQSLWAFLNERDNIIRMETATFLGRPAVEPLSPKLLERFGNEVRRDRVKQCLGHMVRQILEARGYQLDRQNVRIVGDNMFASGTRYKSARPASAGATEQAEGVNKGRAAAV